MSEHRFTCANCGEEKVHVNPGGCGGTGYGIDNDGNKVCYACCGERDRNDMIATGRAVLYLTAATGATGAWRNYVVSNWPGTLNIPVAWSRSGSHNWACSRKDVWFAGPDGYEWHGVCYGDSQLCRCRRTKRKFRPYGWQRLRCA